MPAGVTYESGSVILGADGKPSRFVVSQVKTPKGPMTWLDEMLPDEGRLDGESCAPRWIFPTGIRTGISSSAPAGWMAGSAAISSRWSTRQAGRKAEDRRQRVARKSRHRELRRHPDEGVVCDEPGG